MVTSILGEEATDFSIHGWLRGYAPPGELGSRLRSWSANAIANYLSKRDGGLEPNVPSSDAVIVADVIYPLTERRIKSSLAAFEAGTLDTFSFPLALECGYAFMVDITDIQPESSSRGGILIVLDGLLGRVDYSRLDIDEFVEMFLSLADSARLTQGAVGVAARDAIVDDPRHPVWPYPDGTAYGSHHLTPEGFQRLLVMSNVAGWWLGDEFVGLDRRELLADATFSARPTGAGLWLPAAKDLVKASRHEIARLQWRVESATLRKSGQLAPFLTRVDTSPARAEDFNLNRALVNRSDHSWGWPESMRITFDSSELRSGEESVNALMSIVNAWANYGAEGGFDAVGPFHGLTGEHWDDNSYTWRCDFGYTSPEALEIALIDLHRSVQYWATGNLFFGPVRLEVGLDED